MSAKGRTLAAAAFEAQARSCESLGSPFMARLMRLLHGALPPGELRDRIDGWPGGGDFTGDAVPLRLAGGLHDLVHSGDPLAAVYPPNEVDDGPLRAALADVLARREADLLPWLDNPPQTNEVRRAACLIASAHLLAARHGLSLVVSELGASAGLNLLFDRFALNTPDGPRGAADPILTLSPDWTGPVPPAVPFAVAERAGVDRAPIDVRDPAQRRRLMAYLWPDQPLRARMTRAAIVAGPPPLERADAVDWLERRLALAHPGALHLVYHTVFWQYLPPEARERAEALLAQAGARATADAPLARLGMEGDGGRGAAVTLTTWPGGRTELLGRICFHGRWTDWRAAA